jgi:heptosyltransferase-1
LNVLLVKLSSLGDVVHTLPVLRWLQACVPQVRVGWVVEPAFAPLLRLAGVDPVIEAPLRAWKGRWFSAEVSAERSRLHASLQQQPWDAVLDLQGLVKSAWVMRQVRLAPNGFTAGLGNRTDGSAWEWPVRWLQQRSIRLAPRVHAAARGLELAQRALNLPPGLGADHALNARPLLDAARLRTTAVEPSVVLVHGTSRADKLWPEGHWVQLGGRLVAQGYTLLLPGWGSDEQARSERLAIALGPKAVALPPQDIASLTRRMAACAGCVGVDSGVSHIAVALDLPHVQIYNLPTAWRTGPVAGVFGSQRQVAVQAPGPAVGATPPSVDAVWSAWLGVSPAQPRA